MHLDSIVLVMLTYTMNGLHVSHCKHLLFLFDLASVKGVEYLIPDRECRNHFSVNEQRLTISLLANTFANETNLSEFKRYTTVETAVF
jgi:hypothetical protein